jgi:hypothetical protein
MSNTNTIESGQASQQLQRSTERSTNTLIDLIKAPFAFAQKHLFAASIIALLLFGWSRRDDNYLSAENGTGYALGIIGGTLMLLLILYPVSKRTTLLKRLLPMRYWFGLHMFFGIIGPVMILFHANFQIGSLNSMVALFSMLLVAGSGLIGKYIYTNIHHGLYGRRICVQELRDEAKTEYEELSLIYAMDEKLNRRQSIMEKRVMQDYTGITLSLVHVMLLAIDSRRLKYGVKRILKSAGHGEVLSVNDDGISVNGQKRKMILEFVDSYSQSLRKVATFRVYERLFSLWHILHLPLFIMMIITAVIHIFATHIY